MTPLFSASSMAGIMIVSSSFPNKPSSPAWGFNESTAIRGFTIPKSCLSDWLNMRNFDTISSTVILEGTSANGICPVTKATRRPSFIKIINAFRPTPPKRSSRYSVCPGKWNSSFWILCLLIGAVSNTSTAPRFKSVTAASKAKNAASPAIDVDCDNSTFVSSSTQLMIFTRLIPASSAWEMMFIFTGGNSNAFRW